MNARLAAVYTLRDVLEDGKSLMQLIPAMKNQLSPEDQGFYQELCYGTLRHLNRLERLMEGLINKKIRAKDYDIELTILVGLYQLIYLRTPEHAAISATVDVVQGLKKPWAKGLVNAVLRNYTRTGEGLLEKIDQNWEDKYSIPDWLLNRIKKAYKKDTSAILEALNESAPMCLRINPEFISREDYIEQLNEVEVDAQTHSAVTSAVCLERAVGVDRLPHFDEGWVSVQDPAAQLAAHLLEAEPHERILDACAAPGGKTGHILESVNGEAELIALDSDGMRLARVQENLERLEVGAELIEADAADLDAWWDGTPFDRILLDAPCSATGVIRRHPDIKWLRREDDIAQLVEVQASILKALWNTLKPNGRLVYATCSILPDENVQQIEAFQAETPDATEIKIDADWGIEHTHGRPVRTGIDGMYGFYYAVLQKNA